MWGFFLVLILEDVFVEGVCGEFGCECCSFVVFVEDGVDFYEFE